MAHAVVDGIDVEDSDWATERRDSRELLLGGCVETGELHQCSLRDAGGRPKDESDVTHPRHPDFARHFCKTVFSKRDTIALIREVAKEKHRRTVLKERQPPSIEHNALWRNVVMWGDDMTNPEPARGENCYERSRKWLAVKLESKLVAFLLVALLVLDLACLSVEIVLQELYRDAHGDTAARVDRVEEGLRFVSITILSLFALEIVLLLYSFSLYFFTKPFYVLDLLVVSLSLFAELFLRNVLAAGLLVLLRGWRLVRIFHGVYSIGTEGKTELVHKLHDTAHALLETHWELQLSLRESTALRERLQAAARDKPPEAHRTPTMMDAKANQVAV